MSEKKGGGTSKQTLQTLQTLQTRRIKIPRKISFTHPQQKEKDISLYPSSVTFRFFVL
ncbi:MAG: hypothetical protein F6K58_28785 [Symploca sp. SIO2E9]|nr:hypothetical protein [Symploca sp. SIO2E9]